MVKKLKILELFSGTECLSNAFRKHGHECFTVDWDEKFPSSWHTDISKITAQDIIDKFGVPDIVHIGTDCTSYSVAAISKHRRKNEITKNLDPISDYAKFCDSMNQHVLQIMKELNPKLIFIENPRGALRKMSWMINNDLNLKRYTITYCQYGDFRMKPTDIFTNHPNPSFKPACKNGMHCHEAAKRGSRNGSQRLKNAEERSKYPDLLCEHIVDICEDYFTNINVLEECRDCKHISDNCKNIGKCDKYICKYNLDLRLDINNPVIIYN